MWPWLRSKKRFLLTFSPMETPAVSLYTDGSGLMCTCTENITYSYNDLRVKPAGMKTTPPLRPFLGCSPGTPQYDRSPRRQPRQSADLVWSAALQPSMQTVACWPEEKAESLLHICSFLKCPSVDANKIKK